MIEISNRRTTGRRSYDEPACFLWKSLPQSGKPAERVEKPGVPLSQPLQGPRKELFLLIHLLR